MIFFILSFVMKATFYRTKLGTFKTSTLSDSNKILITTDYGQFMIDGNNRTIRIRSTEEREITVAFDDIKGIKYKYNHLFAVLPELLFGGLPLLKKYEDTFEWYHLHIVHQDGTEIPLYSIGNYEERGLCTGWKIFLEKTILSKIGIYESIELRSKEVLSAVQESFRSTGVPSRLL